MNEFINKVKQDFQTKEIYIECQLEQWKQNSKVIRTNYVILSMFSFAIISIWIIKRIENNTVITFSASTGSDKSSLLPALLIAEGYEKVIVT